VLVRFFTGDPPEMAAKARSLISQADAGLCTLVIPAVILAETFFTLESFYRLDRTAIARTLLDFISCPGIDVFERVRVSRALELCRDQRAHFADAYLAASGLDLGHAIVSFDRDFDKFKNITRIEPE
jgi:predicted nucleic acid-binding protein